MIFFQKVRMKNFLSYGNYFSEIDLSAHKTNLIIGTNGVGKTTIFESLVFALFGRAYRRINKPNLINSINGKGLESEVEFSVTENEKSNHYKVRRGMKPNIFELYINGVKQNEKDNIRDQQKFLEENILKANYKTFTQMILLGSSGYTPFMNLTSSQRRDFIENLLDIDIFSIMNTLLKDRNLILKELKDKINAKEKTLQTLIQKQYSFVEKLQEQKDNETSDIDNEIRLQRSRIEEQQIEIDKLYKEIDTINKEKNDKDKRLYETEQDKLQSDISNLTANINKMKKDIKFLESHTQCPTCKQSIDDEYKSTYVTKTKESIKTFGDEQNQSNDKYIKLKEKIKEIENVNKKYFEITTKIQAVERNIAHIQKDIDRLTEKRDNVKSDNIDTENELLEKYYEDRRKLVDYKSTILDKDELYRVAFDLLKDNGIKSRIISQYVPIINKLINQYLQEMSFPVTFTLDETFNEKILSRYRDEFTYDNFSQGEKMRIDIALLMVWRVIAEMKNSIHTNLLLMDEVFDSSLDESGIEDFLKIIQEVSNMNNIYIISHKLNQINSKFDRVIMVDKQNDFSYISVVE